MNDQAWSRNPLVPVFGQVDPELEREAPSGSDSAPAAAEVWPLLCGAARVDRRLKQLLPRRKDPPCSSRGGKRNSSVLVALQQDHRIDHICHPVAGGDLARHLPHAPVVVGQRASECINGRPGACPEKAAGRPYPQPVLLADRNANGEQLAGWRTPESDDEVDIVLHPREQRRTSRDHFITAQTLTCSRDAQPLLIAGSRCSIDERTSRMK